MTLSTTSPGDERLPHADSVQQPSERYCEACERNVTEPCNDRICSTPEVAQWGAAAQPVPGGIGVYGDADHAAWLADKIVALGDYAKEAAQMLRRWPAAEPIQSGSVGEAADWVNEWSDKHEVPLDNRARSELIAALSRQAPAAPAEAGEGLIERLKQEARIHAQEARTANATIAEIYQIVTGKTGEPGNWNGAEPVRKCIEELRSRLPKEQS